MDPQKSRETYPLDERGFLRGFSNRRTIFILAGMSIFFLLLTIVGTVYILNWGPWAISESPKLTPPASLDELATQYPEIGKILLDPALGSVYKDFIVAYQEGGMEAALEMARKRGLMNDQDEIRITLELDTTDTASIVAQLESYGIRVTAASANLIDIAIPIDLIEASFESDEPGAVFGDLSGLEHVVRIRFPIPTSPNRGNVETESLSMINAEAWHSAGYTGKGLKIGVLDHGFDKYKSLLGTDLPNNVTVRSFADGVASDNAGTEHGTACAEIIYDIAPEAELYLVNYSTLTEEFEAIDWLVGNGVKIISHSVGGLLGPFDGTGLEARKVDELFNKGILWVNSAGNHSEAHYRGVFTDVDGDGYHEFSQGDELMAVQPLGGRTTFALNWDDYTAGNQDYDLYLYDANQNEIAASFDTQDGGDFPLEAILYNFPDSGPYYIAFYKSKATRNVLFDFFAGGNGATLEYYNPDHSLLTPADARGSLTVGATNWRNDQLETFSSQGPTSDGRVKPDLVAPDRTSSAAYNDEFPGTSASAPHVAGAAALVWQAFPNFSVAQVMDYLKSQAIDLGDRGPDNQFGFGRLFLGAIPNSNEVPVSTATQVSVVIQPTHTAVPGATATSTRSPTATPKPAADSSALLPLAFIGCIVLPGMLTFGGVGLIGLILYRGKFQQTKKPALQPRPGRYPQPRAIPAREAMHNCPRCGTPYRLGARFCRYCGLDLKTGVAPEDNMPLCSNCGQPLKPTSKFCPNCGHPRM